MSCHIQLSRRSSKCHLVVEAVPEGQLGVTNDRSRLHKYSDVIGIFRGGVPLGRGLNVPLTVSGVGEPGGVCLVLENVEPLVDDSVRVVSLVADGEERKSVRVRALPHAPLRETVPEIGRAHV